MMLGVTLLLWQGMGHPASTAAQSLDLGTSGNHSAALGNTQRNLTVDSLNASIAANAPIGTNAAFATCCFCCCSCCSWLVLMGMVVATG